MTIGTCKLCENNASLVRSHVVPRSFYGQFSRRSRNQEILNLIGSESPTRRTKLGLGGLYGRFVCLTCEQKFGHLDETAYGILIGQRCLKSHTQMSAQPPVTLLKYALSRDEITQLHLFAASLLWRASACGLEAYGEIALGPYQSLAREAILTGVLPDKLASDIGIWHMRFSGDEPGFDATFEPLTCCDFTEADFGDFAAWTFGYPHGRLTIRLGAGTAKAGFFEIDLECRKQKRRATIWTCQIGDAYPEWAVMVSPRRSIDGAVEEFRGRTDRSYAGR